MKKKSKKSKKIISETLYKNLLENSDRILIKDIPKNVLPTDYLCISEAPWGELILSIKRDRDETDQEYKKRQLEERIISDNRTKRQYEEYLRLKKLYEGRSKEIQQ